MKKLFLVTGLLLAITISGCKGGGGGGDDTPAPFCEAEIQVLLPQSLDDLWLIVEQAADDDKIVFTLGQLRTLVREFKLEVSGHYEPCLIVGDVFSHGSVGERTLADITASFCHEDIWWAPTTTEEFFQVLYGDSPEFTDDENVKITAALLREIVALIESEITVGIKTCPEPPVEEPPVEEPPVEEPPKEEPPVDPCEEDPYAEGCTEEPPVDPCEEDPYAEGCMEEPPVDPCDEDPYAEGCTEEPPMEEPPSCEERAAMYAADSEWELPEPICTDDKPMFPVCHKWNTTLYLPYEAIPAHLSHGDSLGYCPVTRHDHDDDDDDDHGDDDDKKEKVYICHVAASGQQVTLKLPYHAAQKHLTHHGYDYEGKCEKHKDHDDDDDDDDDDHDEDDDDYDDDDEDDDEHYVD